jgi:hypothetical protein
MNIVSTAVRGLLLVMAIVAMSTPAPAYADAAPAESPKLSSAEKCQPCHTEIYNLWKKSGHARSYADPIFQTAFQKAYTETAGSAKTHCLKCHAPMVTVSGDYAVADTITREGVTCDFCHSITDVDLKHPATPFTLTESVINRKGQSGTAHGVMFSNVTTSPTLCAGCHDFINVHGVRVGATYQEWLGSQHAEAGITCATCHMNGLGEGDAKTADHSMGRNLSALRNAVTVTVTETQKSARRLGVTVTLASTGVGHYAPTGAANRSLALDVTTFDNHGRLIETQRRLFGKTVVDENGAPLASDGELFLHGAKVIDDTRLKPGEARSLKFVFATRPDDVANVEAEVFLLYEPVVSQKIEMKTPLSSVSKPVK